MGAAARHSSADQRRSARHSVDFPLIAEHRQLGNIRLRIANVSMHGFMAHSDCALHRGDRIVIRLPRIGRIEAYMVWTSGGRSGFQFERIIRFDDFAAMIAAM